MGTSFLPPFGKFLDPFHGFWQNAYENKSSEDFSLEGLKSPVTIFTDSLGIPHVFAQNEKDLYGAQGFITARDRLWQMEFQTHASAGRLTEILGDGPRGGILDFDRSQRRLGMVMAANNFLMGLEADTLVKELVQSYTDGINQYIDNLSYEDLPFEYKLLNYYPEPWTNLKVGLLQKYMAKTLNIGDKDMEMTNALKMLGKEKLQLLFPEHDPVGDPIVDQPGKWNFNPIKIDSIPLAVPDTFISINLVVEKPTDNIGSNNWAISGSKTASGSPILCNDPHLTLSLPSIWYSIHLNSPEVNVMGVSIPGAPGIIIGFNDSIAWGMTNAQRDLVDWYKVQFKDDSRDEYLSDDVWKKSNKVVERFIRKGKDDFYDTVVYTHHGPITYDKSFHSENAWNQLAFRWISHDVSNESKTFYLLNKAQNHNNYLEALNYWTSPGQNFAFASVKGDIAMRIQGKYPVRRKNEGRFVMDGTKTSNEWKAFIPNNQNVQYKNPERGFVSSANQYPVDLTYPYYINATSYEAYRNRRINQRLTALDSITPQDMMDLQQDNYSIKAQEVLPRLLQLTDSSEYSETETKVRAILRSWDFQNNPKLEAPAYFDRWWSILYSAIWDEFMNTDIDLPNPTSFNTIKLINQTPIDFPYFDRVATPEKETLVQIANESFKQAVADIENWKSEKNISLEWATYKDTYIEHLLRQEPLSVDAPNGGNRESVNASTRRHGPSWRMVVSLEKGGVKAWGVYPGGQSGNPGSKLYDNLVDEWVTGKYFQLHFSKKRDAYSTIESIINLNPAN